MTDDPDRRRLMAKLLAMKDLPWPDAGPAVPSQALGLSPAQVDAVRSALPGEVSDWLEDRSLATKALGAMSPEESDAVHDAAYSALMNAAPIVRSYTARQDKGPYPIWITGFAGVYLLMAAEHDTLGPFGTLAAAVDAMEHHHGRFLVGD